MKTLCLTLIVVVSSVQAGFGQARIIKLPELQKIMAEGTSKVHVINFWATWCGPCIKELPYFEKVSLTRGPDVRVTLVSLDLDLDPDPAKVYRFISSKKIKSEVVLLDETDPGSWIDKIDQRWSGALPATIIINRENGQRIFIGKSLQEGQLEQYLDNIQ